MDRLDPRAIDRIAGPAWAVLRPQFATVHESLIRVAPRAAGELTTIYIKYSSPETSPHPFAVVWVKKSTEIIVGLALRADEVSSELGGPPAGCKYAGLTGFLKVTSGTIVPDQLSQWARRAFENIVDVASSSRQ